MLMTTDRRPQPAEPARAPDPAAAAAEPLTDHGADAPTVVGGELDDLGGEMRRLAAERTAAEARERDRREELTARGRVSRFD